MPLDTLTPRLGGIPDVANAQVARMPQLPDLSTQIAGMEKNVQDVIDKFSPLSQAQRRVELAKLAALQTAFHYGASGQPEKMAELMGAISGRGSPYTESFDRTKGMINAYTESGITPKGGATPKPISNAAALAAKGARDRAAAIAKYKEQQGPTVETPTSLPPRLLNPETQPDDNSGPIPFTSKT